MKISVIILLLITAISCSRKTASSKFAGTWSGTYSSRLIEANPPLFDTGTLKIVVDANNSATGTLQSLHGGSTTSMHGTVDPSSGAISIGTGDEGGNVNVFFDRHPGLPLGDHIRMVGYKELALIFRADRFLLWRNIRKSS
jgi:hypothetical protein